MESVSLSTIKDLSHPPMQVRESVRMLVHLLEIGYLYSYCTVHQELDDHYMVNQG